MKENLKLKICAGALAIMLFFAARQGSAEPLHVIQGNDTVNIMKILSDGAAVQKPTCQQNETPAIFVVPVNAIGVPSTGLDAIPIVGISAWAEEDTTNPQQWKIHVQVKSEDNKLSSGLKARALVHIRCCLRKATGKPDCI